MEAPEAPPSAPTTDRPRKRTIPKDANTRVFDYAANSLEDLADTLDSYLQDPPEDAEHSVYKVTFWVGTTFPIRPPQTAGYADRDENEEDATNTMSITEAVDVRQVNKVRDHKQRAIARSCIRTIQRIDGFRYSFHNSWMSREDEAFRFSYYCNDSLLNKCRAANSRAATISQRAKKAVYDCKGVIHIKFSAKQQSLAVEYRHIPLHKTYEERAPPPRRNSKRKAEEEQEGRTNVPRAPRSPRRPRGPDGELVAPKKRGRPRKPRPEDLKNSVEYDILQASLVGLLDVMKPEEKQKEEEQRAKERERLRLAEQAARAAAMEPTFTSCRGCQKRKIKCDGPQQKKNNRNKQSRQNDTVVNTSNDSQPQITPDNSLALTEARTEVELLRAKLAEAEQKIQEYESERQLHQEQQQYHQPAVESHSSFPPEPHSYSQTSNPLQHSSDYRVRQQANASQRQNTMPTQSPSYPSSVLPNNNTPTTSAAAPVRQNSVVTAAAAVGTQRQFTQSPHQQQPQNQVQQVQHVQHQRRQAQTPAQFQPPSQQQPQQTAYNYSWGNLYDYTPQLLQNGYTTNGNYWTQNRAAGR